MERTASLGIDEVRISASPIERFRTVLLPEEFEAFREAMTDMARLARGRTIWNVSSTAAGGGVSEMLHVLLAYARGEGIDVRWVVLDGPSAFFEFTKRLHHGLHGSSPPGQGTQAGDPLELYERVNADFAERFQELLRPQDMVMVHDPQPAGIIPELVDNGGDVVWRCHVGSETENEHSDEAWGVLRRYVGGAHALTFTRDAYVPRWVEGGRAHVIAPSIDPFSPKNIDLPLAHVQSIVEEIGLVAGAGTDSPPAFRRTDGSVSHVTRPAEIHQVAPVPEGAPLIVQVSRWDPLKDMAGVMQAFADHLVDTDAHLALVGPETGSVSDDPEAAGVLSDCISRWRGLPQVARERVHLVELPMEDLDENAAMVNALQRYATVVTQKSLREGFGLTVAEAMWKATPVVATAVGGIREQIEHGRNGLLIEDPEDHRAFAAGIRSLLDDPELADDVARRAKEQVRRNFLGNRHLQQYLPLFQRVAS